MILCCDKRADFRSADVRHPASDPFKVSIHVAVVKRGKKLGSQSIFVQLFKIFKLLYSVNDFLGVSNHQATGYLCIHTKDAHEDNISILFVCALDNDVCNPVRKSCDNRVFPSYDIKTMHSNDKLGRIFRTSSSVSSSSVGERRDRVVSIRSKSIATLN